MPFDGIAERSAPVQLPGAPPLEARIIDEALNILGPNGEKWIQGDEAHAQHNHCMIGAVRLARRELKESGDDTERLIAEVIRRGTCRRPLQFIENFDDERGRRFGQVREAFLLAKGEALRHAGSGDAPEASVAAALPWLCRL